MIHCKINFSIEDFFSKCGQFLSKLQIWSHLLKKSVMENFILLDSCLESASLHFNWLATHGLFWNYFCIYYLLGRRKICLSLSKDWVVCLNCKYSYWFHCSSQTIPIPSKNKQLVTEPDYIRVIDCFYTEILLYCTNIGIHIKS